MDQKQIVKQMLEFNQSTFNNAFDMMTLFQDQFETVANAALDQTNVLPAEGRQIMENWGEIYKSGRHALRTQINNNFKQAENLFAV